MNSELFILCLPSWYLSSLHLPRTRQLYTHLEEVVSVTKARSLSLTVISPAAHLFKSIVKVFSNNFIEKLHVSANW